SSAGERREAADLGRRGEGAATICKGARGPGGHHGRRPRRRLVPARAVKPGGAQTVRSSRSGKQSRRTAGRPDHHEHAPLRPASWVHFFEAGGSTELCFMRWAQSEAVAARVATAVLLISGSDLSSL